MPTKRHSPLRLLLDESDADTLDGLEPFFQHSGDAITQACDGASPLPTGEIGGASPDRGGPRYGSGAISCGRSEPGRIARENVTNGDLYARG